MNNVLELKTFSSLVLFRSQRDLRKKVQTESGNKRKPRVLVWHGKAHPTQIKSPRKQNLGIEEKKSPFSGCRHKTAVSTSQSSIAWTEGHFTEHVNASKNSSYGK